MLEKFRANVLNQVLSCRCCVVLSLNHRNQFTVNAWEKVVLELSDRISNTYILQRFKNIYAFLFRQFSTYTNPLIHLFHTPKLCIGIVLDFFWGVYMF